MRLIDPKVLYDSYVPKKILFRENEYRQLMEDLKLVQQGFPPSQIVVWGPPGCGKTVTVKKAFADAGIKHYYVMCRNTEYLTLMELCKVVLGTERLGRGLLPWRELEPKLSGCYVILDEADKFMLRGGDELLYSMSRAPNVGLVLISNKMDLLLLVKDARVQSSLLPTKLWFRAYNFDEVKAILLSRAEEAVADVGTVLTEGILNLIAAKAIKKEGDVRFAIKLLRESLKLALVGGAEQISEEHVKRAEEWIGQMELDMAFGELTVPQRLLLLCAKYKDTPGKIYELYNQLAPKCGLSTVTDRRLRMVMSELELFGLVNVCRQGSTTYKVSLANWFDHDKAEELLKASLFQTRS